MQRTEVIKTPSTYAVNLLKIHDGNFPPAQCVHTHTKKKNKKPPKKPPKNPKKHTKT